MRLAKVRCAACLLVALLASSCAPSTELTPIGNTMTIMAPDQAFASSIGNGKIPADWSFRGRVGPQNLSIQNVQGLWSLELVSSDQYFELYRRVHAKVLATPFLSWSWRGILPREGSHPVRIRLGIAQPDAITTTPWWSVSRNDPNRVRRVVEVVWGDTALSRGTLIGPRRINDDIEQVSYFVRGGPEQGLKWWTDTIDLSLILAQAWPNDAGSNWEIKFIGISSQATASTAAMNIANLRLSR